MAMTQSPPKKPYATFNLLSRKAKDERQAGALNKAASEGKSYSFQKKSRKPTTIQAGDKTMTATGRGTTVTAGTKTSTETSPGKSFTMTAIKPATEKKTFVAGDMQGNKIHNRKSHLGSSSNLNESPEKTNARIEAQESMERKSKLGMINDEAEKSVKSGYATPGKTSHGGKEYFGKVETTKSTPETKEVSIAGVPQQKTTKKSYLKISPKTTMPKAADRSMGSQRSHVKWLDSRKETKPFTKMTNQGTSKSNWSGSGYKFNKIKKKA